MEYMPLISIVVPVYKVEAYLDKCISSVVGQTYKNLEIILVDDGSPDRCAAMCDAWAAKDNRIKVIHKENGGLSDARNAGMTVAVGEYIGFVDSDDYVAPDMYRLLLEKIIADGSDIAACGVEMIFEDGSPSRMLTGPGTHVMTTEEALRAVIEESWIKQPVWYKLYKTAMVSDLPFPVGKYHEDVFWTYQAVGRARQVSVFDKPCYYYIQRTGSIMGEKYSLRRLDSLEAKIARIEYMRRFFPALEIPAKRDLWFSCMYAMQMLMMHCSPETQDEGNAAVQSAFHRHPIRFKDLDWSNPKQCLWLMLAKASVKMTCLLRNRLGIGC